MPPFCLILSGHSQEEKRKEMVQGLAAIAYASQHCLCSHIQMTFSPGAARLLSPIAIFHEEERTMFMIGPFTICDRRGSSSIIQRDCVIQCRSRSMRAHDLEKSKWGAIM